MTNICVTVKDGKAKAELVGVLTAGMVGVPVTFSFGPEWQDLSITAVFKGSAKTIDRVLIGTENTTVPHEVLALAGSSLWIGAEGRNAAGDLVIPSTMVKAGDIHCGADPSGDVSLDPTQPVWAELMTMVNELASTADGSVKSVNGKAPDDNGNVDVTGGYYIPEVSREDGNTVVFDFVSSQSDMPAVEAQRITVPTVSGVYVGSGQMPEGYDIQIDPNAEADVPATQDWVLAQINSAVNDTWEGSY